MGNQQQKSRSENIVSQGGFLGNDSEAQPNKQETGYSMFNDQYEIVEKLGDGHTSRVYLARDHNNSESLVAIKIFKQQFFKNSENAVQKIENEISIQQDLDHLHINRVVSYGSDGFITKPSGKQINNLVFLMVEYIPGGLLFDFCQANGAMGEDCGRYFMIQFADVLDYLHNEKKTVHRDLKLENVMLTEDLKVVIVDFGFATYKDINCLISYQGTKTYIAPEIHEDKIYDGRKVDIFATGVILFVLVVGHFPFLEAKEEDKDYKLLMDGKFDRYWRQFKNSHKLSYNFKILMESIFSHNPCNRPTVQEIQEHSWMNEMSFDAQKTQTELVESLNHRKAEISTQDSEKQVLMNTDDTNIIKY